MQIVTCCHYSVQAPANEGFCRGISNPKGPAGKQAENDIMTPDPTNNDSVISTLGAGDDDDGASVENHVDSPERRPSVMSLKV